LGKRLINLSQTHTEVLGAAVLSGISLGVYSDYSDAFHKTVTLGKYFDPNQKDHAAYNRLFLIYKQIYTEVKHHFAELASMDLPQAWINRENLL
jgi:sugar (pentulose or hexulose) kinase